METLAKKYAAVGHGMEVLAEHNPIRPWNALLKDTMGFLGSEVRMKQGDPLPRSPGPRIGSLR